MTKLENRILYAFLNKITDKHDLDEVIAKYDGDKDLFIYKLSLDVIKVLPMEYIHMVKISDRNNLISNVFKYKSNLDCNKYLITHIQKNKGNDNILYQLISLYNILSSIEDTIYYYHG